MSKFEPLTKQDVAKIELAHKKRKLERELVKKGYSKRDAKARVSEVFSKE